MVISLLTMFEVIDVDFFDLILSGFLFKVLFAMLDTPVAYLLVYGIRRYFGLKGHGAELDF